MNTVIHDYDLFKNILIIMMWYRLCIFIVVQSIHYSIFAKFLKIIVVTNIL